MGNFEKLVVLTILFLSAIVLAVSLQGGDEVEAGSPLDAAEARLEAVGGETRAPLAEAGKPGYLLDSELAPASAAEVKPSTRTRRSDRASEAKPDKPAEESAVRAKEAGGRLKILRDRVGLASAPIDDYMVYTVADDDTWAALSKRFYGAGRYVENLRAANEEVAVLQPGEKIYVPVYDFAREAGMRPRLQPVAQPATRAPAAAAEAVRAPAAAAGALYEVRDGDNLSTISLRVYGTSVRWKEIFEANRAQLESPDWLQVGMRITIPGLDELPEIPLAASGGQKEPTPKPVDKPGVR